MDWEIIRVYWEWWAVYLSNHLWFDMLSLLLR
jgi:hypothetical protein